MLIDGDCLKIHRLLLAITCLLLVSCSMKVEVSEIANDKIYKGKIERLLVSSSYSSNRFIDVWLPEGYPKDAPYNVIYAHDGEALFGLAKPDVFNSDEWRVDETISHLMQENVMPATIVVGIHNLGELRTEEYFPEKVVNEIDEDTLKLLAGDTFVPRADDYLRFIVKELKPYIDSHYEVNTRKENTFTMGSSMGGLISMYAQCEYPDIFGGAACLSTHFVGLMKANDLIPNLIVKYMSENLPSSNSGHKFYFDYGDQGLDSLYATYQQRVDSVMELKGYTEEQWQTYFFKGEEHSPVSWAKRLDIPLRFLSSNIGNCHVGAKNRYRLYFLGGQSNMEGFGYSKELPDSLDKVHYDVMLFNGTIAGDNDTLIAGNGHWDYLRPGNGTGYKIANSHINCYSDRFGPELTFGIQIAKEYPGERIALIKYGRGGSSLLAGTSGFGTWDPDYLDGNGLNQYDHFLTTLKNAMRVEDIDGDGVEDELIPCGIIWMQGEADSSSLQTASVYSDNLKRLMYLLRAALRNNDIPIVFGKISDSVKSGPGKHYIYENMIHEAQKRFVDKDRHSIIVENTENYHFIEDGYHFTSADYVDLGEAFAKAIKKISDK